MRVVDTDYRSGRVSDGVVDYLPVVFRSGENVIVVCIFSEVDGFLNPVGVGQGEDVVSARVSNKVVTTGDGQVADSKFKRFPVAVVEGLPLRSAVYVIVSRILAAGIDEITVGGQVSAGEIKTLTYVNIFDGQSARTDNVSHANILSGLAVSGVDVDADKEISFAERRANIRLVVGGNVSPVNGIDGVQRVGSRLDVANGQLVDKSCANLPADFNLSSAGGAGASLFDCFFNGRTATQRAVGQTLRTDLEGRSGGGARGGIHLRFGSNQYVTCSLASDCNLLILR